MAIETPVLIEAQPLAVPPLAAKETVIEFTILMPCLNEAETLAACIRKAHKGANNVHLETDTYEIVVADNGSTDGSQEIALREGARLVTVPIQGYGAALQAGMEAARGKFIIMGDSDDSYDFANISAFVDKLREGYQMVMGSRFKGEIKPGAMPFLHQYLGNPMLTFIGNSLFRCGFTDFHSGLRAFDRDAILNLQLRTTGMEYASEMVIRATLANLSRTEVPVTLFPDGRSRPPHLHTWRDGWRHLRFMLLYSPRWLLFYPGMILSILGTLGMIILLPGPIHVGSVVLDVHTMLVSMTMALVGLQLIFMAVFTRVYTMHIGILPSNPRLERFVKRFSLGAGLVVSIVFFLIGIGIYGFEVIGWSRVGFGPLNYQITLRSVIWGTAFVIAGLQLFFWSFNISVLGLRQAVPVSTVSTRPILTPSIPTDPVTKYAPEPVDP